MLDQNRVHWCQTPKRLRATVGLTGKTRVAIQLADKGMTLVLCQDVGGTNHHLRRCDWCWVIKGPESLLITLSH